jgi:hypothetical protein
MARHASQGGVSTTAHPATQSMSTRACWLAGQGKSGALREPYRPLIPTLNWLGKTISLARILLALVLEKMVWDTPVSGRPHSPGILCLNDTVLAYGYRVVLMGKAAAREVTIQRIHDHSAEFDHFDQTFERFMRLSPQFAALFQDNYWEKNLAPRDVCKMISGQMWNHESTHLRTGVSRHALVCADSWSTGNPCPPSCSSSGFSLAIVTPPFPLLPLPALVQGKRRKFTRNRQPGLRSIPTRGVVTLGKHFSHESDQLLTEVWLQSDTGDLLLQMKSAASSIFAELRPVALSYRPLAGTFDENELF